MAAGGPVSRRCAQKLGAMGARRRKRCATGETGANRGPSARPKARTMVFGARGGARLYGGARRCSGALATPCVLCVSCGVVWGEVMRREEFCQRTQHSTPTFKCKHSPAQCNISDPASIVLWRAVCAFESSRTIEQPQPRAMQYKRPSFNCTLAGCVSI